MMEVLRDKLDNCNNSSKASGDEKDATILKLRSEIQFLRANINIVASQAVSEDCAPDTDGSKVSIQMDKLMELVESIGKGGASADTITIPTDTPAVDTTPGSAPPPLEGSGFGDISPVHTEWSSVTTPTEELGQEHHEQWSSATTPTGPDNTGQQWSSETTPTSAIGGNGIH